MAEKGSKPFPNESAEYRKARTVLLAEEIELRRHIQRVAAMRRALPPGGEAKDYRFLDQDGKRHETYVPYVRGFPSHPMSRQDVEAKAEALMGPRLGGARTRSVIGQRLAIAIVGCSSVARQLALLGSAAGAT
jgi:hypothetical protein